MAPSGWLRFRYHPQKWLIQLPWGRPRFRHGDDHHEQGDHSDGGESQEGRVVAKCRDDVAGRVNDGIDEVRTRATKAARSARRFASEARERLEDAVDAGTEAYRESLRSAD